MFVNIFVTLGLVFFDQLFHGLVKYIKEHVRACREYVNTKANTNVNTLAINKTFERIFEQIFRTV